MDNAGRAPCIVHCLSGRVGRKLLQCPRLMCVPAPNVFVVQKKARGFKQKNLFKKRPLFLIDNARRAPMPAVQIIVHCQLSID